MTNIKNMSGDHLPGNKVVLGIFQHRTDLERAIDTLKAQGFRNADVSVLMPNPSSNDNVGITKESKAPEGATTGAASGVALGGALGWLVGAGALAIPGIGPFVAAGPILSMIAGAGLGGVGGGVIGGLIGVGIPEYEAKRFEGHVKEGGMLLSVHVDDLEWSKKAKDILTSCGAKDISQTTESSGKKRPSDHQPVVNR